MTTVGVRPRLDALFPRIEEVPPAADFAPGGGVGRGGEGSAGRERERRLVNRTFYFPSVVCPVSKDMALHCVEQFGRVVPVVPFGPDVYPFTGHGRTSNFVNTDYLFWDVHSATNMAVQERKEPVNQDAIVVPIVWAANLTMSNASLQGCIYT